MRRLPQNPLIRPQDVAPSREDFEVAGAFNPGVGRLGDEVVLLVRVAERPKARDEAHLVAPVARPGGGIEVLRFRRDDPDVEILDERWFRYRGGTYLTSISHLRAARSTDGARFAVDAAPAILPSTPTEAFGVEDPRITRIGGDHWITYKAVSSHGIATALAHTRDYASYDRHGVILCPENLDVVIFPEKIAGGYAALTRPAPMNIGPPAIWLARSPDLLHWGRHEPLVAPRPGMWDSGRVGASCVPFRTPAGWLLIYHGADETHRYCVGVALVDGADPSKVLARSREPIMTPGASYEEHGFFGGVVFPTGAVVRDDGGVTVYYGAADQHVCAAETTLDELLGCLADA